MFFKHFNFAGLDVPNAEQRRKMIWPIRSKACWVVPSMAILRHSSCYNEISFSPYSRLSCFLLGLPRKCSAFNPNTEQAYYDEVETTQLGISVKNPVSKLEASGERLELSKDMRNYQVETLPKAEDEVDLFAEMKQKFLNFKKHKYLEELEHFRTLAEVQEPKFMVIACADSRVCPSTILGFQPGEAFMVRNVANLVPPFENGPTETNAALEFAVNTLEVENVFVIGHSRCGGIEALMQMQDNVKTSFTENWINKAKVAKSRAKAAANHLSFDQQCIHCEKESINISLLNLLTYPWIEDRVKKGKLSIHGGYYDFLNCAFEKWSIDIKFGWAEDGKRYVIKDQAYWW